MFVETNYIVSKCKGCGKDIYRAKTDKGKSMPISKLETGEYVSHFSDCPKVQSFRKEKKV